MISIAGKIPIRIYPFFWFLCLLIGWLNSQSVEGTAVWVSIITLSVLVHEYGHALTAMFFGQRAEINLNGFGGLTLRHGGRLSLWKEFLVVLNGPLAGFLLAGMIFFIRTKMEIQESSLWYQAFGIALFVNIFWTIFNLLPVQPLDGGKMLAIFLESLFGLKGVKASFFISMLLSTLLGAVFVVLNNIFAAAIFFLFAFESYRLWKSSLQMKEQDQSFALQHMLKSAESDAKLGRNEEALDKFLRIREMSGSGVIYQSATQHASLVLVNLGKFQDAFNLLVPLMKRLSPEAKKLCQFAAYRGGLWREVADMSSDVYQENPTYDVAFINACSFGHLGEAKPAAGWLQCAIREGLPNAAENIAKNDFDPVRDNPEFSGQFNV